MAEASGTEGAKTPSGDALRHEGGSVPIGWDKVGFSPIGWDRVGRRAQDVAPSPSVLRAHGGLSLPLQPSASTL